MLCYAVCCAVLHYSALCYTTMHCIALQCTVLHYNALCCTTMHCVALQCTMLYYNALCCTTMHCSALQCTTLHVIVNQKWSTLQQSICLLVQSLHYQADNSPSPPPLPLTPGSRVCCHHLFQLFIISTYCLRNEWVNSVADNILIHEETSTMCSVVLPVHQAPCQPAAGIRLNNVMYKVTHVIYRIRFSTMSLATGE